jgi:hypothetical protein
VTGGGTNVAANTQLGKTNTQTIGTTNNTEQKLQFNTADRVFQTTDTSKVKTDTVENLTVNEIPPWVILLLILGWLLPSPNEIGRSILSIFSRKQL